MAKRRNRISLITKVGDEYEERFFTLPVWESLRRLALARDPELLVTNLGLRRERETRHPFTVHKKIGEYFTTDEYTHLAEYLRGAADALELLEKTSLSASKES